MLLILRVTLLQSQDFLGSLLYSSFWSDKNQSGMYIDCHSVYQMTISSPHGAISNGTQIGSSLVDRIQFGVRSQIEKLFCVLKDVWLPLCQTREYMIVIHCVCGNTFEMHIKPFPHTTTLLFTCSSYIWKLWTCKALMIITWFCNYYDDLWETTYTCTNELFYTVISLYQHIV